MGKTIAEKILSIKSGEDARAGRIVLAELDFLMGQDGTSPLAIEAFREMRARRVFNPERICMVIDHSAPSPLESISNLHSLMRRFAAEQRIRLCDVGEGVCHCLLPENGWVLPGDLVIGADSHTTTYGAINAFATGVGSTDLAAGMFTGKLWFKVPSSMRIEINGRLPAGVFSKDLALFLAGMLTADGATYLAVEYAGEAIKAMSVEARFTLSNLAVEMGAKAGLMEADEKVMEWLKGRARRDFQPVFPDRDAEYARKIEIDASSMEPQVACPHAVDNVVPLTEVAGQRIDQAVIGTCTNGRLEDLEIAAGILRGKRVNKGVRLVVAPASRQVLLKGIENGLVSDLVEAGAALVTPGCGPCVGTHNGIPADGEVVFSTANRNFKGRMGNPRASIFLGSPAAVAASAVTGVITDPREFM